MLLIVAGCSDGDAVSPAASAEHVGNLVLLELGIDAALVDAPNLQVSECTDFAGVPNGYQSAEYSTGWSVPDRAAADEMMGTIFSSYGAFFSGDFTNEVEGTMSTLIILSESGERLNGDTDDLVVVTVWVTPSGEFTMVVGVPCDRGQEPTLRAVGEVSAGGV